MKVFDTAGWVYFILADNGLTKIGCTKNLKVRQKSLGVILPYDLQLVCAIYSDRHRELEREIQTDLCADYHIRGEWFRLPKDLFEYLVEDAGYYGSRMKLNRELLRSYA